MTAKYVQPSRRKPALGTVSRATRPEGLIRSFMDALKIYNPRAWNELLHQYTNVFNDMYMHRGLPQVNGMEEHDFLIQSLCDALEKVADRLPYCYFGAIEGDMSDFGFWIDTHSLEESIAMGDIVEIEHEFSYPTRGAMNRKDYFFFCHSDHGEMVLWSKNYKELWRTT